MPFDFTTLTALALQIIFLLFCIPAISILTIQISSIFAAFNYINTSEREELAQLELPMQPLYVQSLAYMLIL